MADKTEKFIQCVEGGVTKVKVQEDLVKSPTLSKDQAVEIAKLLMKLEEEMTKPQDFEWGIEKGSECVCVCVCVCMN
jgi:phosphoenolpyruvate synthase/pyruvate phosphate dikinase